MLNQWLARLRFLFAPPSRHEVDRELQAYLDHQIEANLAAGLGIAEARRQAGIAFGSTERAREACHEQRFASSLRILAYDIRHSLRGFRRNPAFTLTLLATLTLGIGATTAVFSVVDRILFRALPYAHAERLVSIGLVQSLEPQEFLVGSVYDDWRVHQQPFARLAAEGAATEECDLTERNPAQLHCAVAEAALLPMLGIAPVLGRNFLPEEDRPHGPPVALLSHTLWRTRYNHDPALLNRVIHLDGKAVRVVGILPRNFELPSLHEADVLLPLALPAAAERGPGLGAPVHVFARLKPGVSVVEARARLDPLFQTTLLAIPPQIRQAFHLKVRTLRDRQVQAVRPIAWMLLGTAAAVLLIACANIAGLLLARGVARTRETAVRAALGATRQRLALQSITESLLLSLAGSALAEALLRLFLALAPPTIPYLNQTRLDLRLLGFTLGLSLLCGLLFGAAPALHGAAGLNLSARSSTRPSQAKLRQPLVVCQLAASPVLLACAMLFLRGFWHLEHQPLGFDTENTLSAAITLGPHSYGTNEQVRAFFAQLTSRLRFGPGIAELAVADSLPPAANHIQAQLSSIGIAGKPPEANGEGGLVTDRWVSPGYFHALRIPILEGEGFTEKQLDVNEHFVVFSKSLAARLFPGKSPIGQRILLDRAVPGSVGGVVRKASQGLDTYTVAGIAADVKNGGLAGEDLPEYYRLRRNRAEDWDRSGAWGSSAVLLIRTSLPPGILTSWLRTQVAALDPTLPVDVQTLRQRVGKLAAQPRFASVLVGVFALSGLLLAMVGLYGVVALLVAQRTGEIGVRMALGAILRLILGKSLRLAAWGAGLGLLAALAIARTLGSLLFGVGTGDPLSFTCVTLLLIAVALLAAWLPARAASNVGRGRFEERLEKVATQPGERQTSLRLRAGRDRRQKGPGNHTEEAA